MKLMKKLGKLKRKLKEILYKYKKPKLKAKHQFGSPIVGLYEYQGLLVVATKLDIFVTDDGVNYQRVKREEDVYGVNR